MENFRTNAWDPRLSLCFLKCLIKFRELSEKVKAYSQLKKGEGWPLQGPFELKCRVKAIKGWSFQPLQGCAWCVLRGCVGLPAAVPALQITLPWASSGAFPAHWTHDKFRRLDAFPPPPRDPRSVPPDPHPFWLGAVGPSQCGTQGVAAFRKLLGV